jgi:dTDP-glucose 4,6-dehydratase
MQNNYIPKNLLVTGGAGFIGSNFVRYMLEHYPELTIVNLDLLTYAGSINNLAAINQANRHRLIQGNICNRELVDFILREYNIDTVVHFAAESHVDRSIASPDVFVQTNVVGTFTLLEASRQYWLNEKKLAPHEYRFHHISTDEVFGTLSNDAPAFTELTPYAPNSPYSASKAASDHLVRAYHHTYGLATTLTNCSNNYGPYQHGEKLIPTVIRSCIKGLPIPVYGNGKNIRDWLYVEDHCAGIDTVLRKGKLGESYNIGGNNECENLIVIETICSLMQQKLPNANKYSSLVAFVTDRPGHDWRYAIDQDKILMELGWKPKADFAQGLSKTIDWYLKLYQS